MYSALASLEAYMNLPLAASFFPQGRQTLSSQDI